LSPEVVRSGRAIDIILNNLDAQLRVDWKG